MEHVVVVVGLTEEDLENGKSCSVFGRVDVFENGNWDATVRLEVEEELGPAGSSSTRWKGLRYGLWL